MSVQKIIWLVCFLIFSSIVSSIPTENISFDEAKELISPEEQDLFNETSQILTTIDDPEDKFNTQLMKLVTIITKNKKKTKSKKVKQPIETTQSVLHQVIFQSEFLLSVTLQSSEVQNKGNNKNDIDLQLLSNMFQDLETLKMYAESDMTYEKKYWYLKFLGVSLDNTVTTYIKYKLWYINHYKTQFDSKSEIPNLRKLARTIREVKYALDSKVAALELIGRKNISELVFITSETVGSKSTVGNDIKYLQEGGINILKGLAFTTMCFAANLTFCTVTLSGLLSVEVLIWLAILSRTLTVEW
ncbi:hypothetical protein MOUN0_G03598 [Monosporozyma unispora]|nr:hypothetical protein C6P44_005052 [Kazachstania unispora]